MVYKNAQSDPYHLSEVLPRLIKRLADRGEFVEEVVQLLPPHINE